MKTISVTGGTVFSGSNLCARLINEGNNVICFDNNHTGRLSNIREVIGGTSKVVYKDFPSDDPTQRMSVMPSAEEKLGWEPKINLSEGLDKTIEYFKMQINQFGKAV